MKNKTILTFLISFLLFQNSSLFAQYEWRRKECPIIYQGGGSCFTLGNKVYVVGGETSPPLYTSISSLVWEYDGATNIWTQKNNFPHSLTCPTGFVINDTAYLGTGLDSTNTYHTDFWRYDEINDQWIPIASFPGSGRYEAMSFTLNGLGYVGCGHGLTENNDFYAYNPSTDSWSQMANFPGLARQNGFGNVVGNKGYFGFGYGNTGYYRDIYRYNDTLNIWDTINSFTNTGRYSPGSFVINDTLYVIGGQGSNSFFQECWAYDVAHNIWVQHASLACLFQDSIYFQGGFTLNGHGYLIPQSLHFPLYTLLEFGPADTGFTQRVAILGKDTSYNGAFTRILSVPDSCAQWSTGATGASISVSTTGRYWAHWNISCGVASDTIFISNKTGIESISGDNLIEVYPNPSSNGLFNLKLDNELIGSTLEIFDVAGRVIYTDKIREAQTTLELIVETGIYSVKITASDHCYLKKIIRL